MNVAGRKHEMTTEGGEVNFVIKIIKESKLHQSTIKIFTAMLGRKRSINELKQILKSDKEVKSVTVSEFCQGRIMRWGLAWTFHSNIQLEQTIPSKFSKAKQQKKQSAPFTISLDKENELGDSISVFKIISQLLTSDLMADDVTNEKLEKDTCVIRFRLRKPSWRNQRAKRRQDDRLLEGPSNKKLKIDIPEAVGANTEILLDVLLRIITVEHDHGSEKIELNFICRDCVLGRGGLYELVQYFKNKLGAH